MGCAHATKWFLPALLLTLAALAYVAAQASFNPCLRANYKNLTDVHRSISYETTAAVPPLCDMDLVKGWYRFVVDAESKMPEKCVKHSMCGTTVPIWLNGAHPSEKDGIQTRQACANVMSGGASCCEQFDYIKVKNCGRFFVYYLQPTPVCPMAYCAGKDQPCPAGMWSPTGFPPGCKEAYPQLTDPPIFRGPVIEPKAFYFTCDLTFGRNDPDQAFEFVWLFDGVGDPNVPSQIVREPKRSATLDGTKLTGLLNKNVGCKVRAFYKQNAKRKGPWRASASKYWAGIQTDPSRIFIRTDEDKHEVVIRSTLPVFCKWNVADDKCCLWIDLSVTGLQANQGFRVPNDCRYPLCKSDWNNTSQEISRKVSVVASKTEIQSGTKDLLVSFKNMLIADASPYQQIFQDVKIPSVQVDVEKRDSKLCSLTGDPHIEGIEDKRVFHLYRVGDYTAYENVARDFEVQIRTWPCYKERPDRAATCICGVAVREKDDLIRVNGCDKSFYGPIIGSPEITVPRPLREGTTILQSTDGSMITCPHCQDTTHKTGFRNGGWNTQTRKRSVNGKPYVDSDEVTKAYDPNDFADFRMPRLSWPTSTGISESQAENYCSTALRQSQLWSYCQDRSQEIQGLIENCKIDTLVAGSYIGTETIVDNFLTMCKVELAKNPDNYVSTPSGENILKPEISDDVCYPVCYINGRCERGRCVCNRGFVGDNCQIKDEPPKLLGIRGSTLCDINERPCKQLFINAENIQNTATMACKVQEILDDGSVSERASMEEAVFLTLNKLGCYLPDAGGKSLKRFYITATIDGNRYSNAVNLTVYDSSCQSCTQEGCQKLPNTCQINNKCYKDGELNPKDNSQVCCSSASTTEWSTASTVSCGCPVEKGYHGYNKRCLKLYTIKQDYLTARRQCEADGAHLFNFKSREQDGPALLKLMEKNGQQISPHLGQGLWIGADDIVSEGNFVWSDGTPLSRSSPLWSFGQPDNSGNLEDCVEIAYPNNLVLNDYQCVFKLSFVCQADLKM